MIEPSTLEVYWTFSPPDGPKSKFYSSAVCEGEKTVVLWLWKDSNQFAAVFLHDENEKTAKGLNIRLKGHEWAVFLIHWKEQYPQYTLSN